MNRSVCKKNARTDLAALAGYTKDRQATQAWGNQRCAGRATSIRARSLRCSSCRYYASVEALISDAMFERAVPPLESFFRLRHDDPAEAAARAARTMNKLLLDDEVRRMAERLLDAQSRTHAPA